MFFRRLISSVDSAPKNVVFLLTFAEVKDSPQNSSDTAETSFQDGTDDVDTSDGSLSSSFTMFVHVVGVGGGGGGESDLVDGEGGSGVILMVAGIPLRKGSRTDEAILELHSAALMNETFSINR